MNGTLPKYRLVHTNKWGEQHYFQRLGEHWPSNPARRCISRTTPDRHKAVVFDTLPEALAVLLEAGEPADWEHDVVKPDQPHPVTCPSS
jgi:hypothetical protein